MRLVQLGCGFHGRGIAYQLAASRHELRVLDLDADRAAAVGATAGVPSGAVDVADPDALRRALDGAGLVVNAVGPYHRTGLAVVDAAIAAGVHYVDMNDDHEVAEAVLLDPAWDERARQAGVTVLVDCGVVPGLSGMLVRHAARRLADVERVAIRFAWNYDRAYPAAIQHFLRINGGAGPQYLDGGLQRKAPFAGREDFEFLAPVGRTGVYFTGVPDPVAIARFVPGVREATAQGAFYQAEANALMEDLVGRGVATDALPPLPDIPRRDLPLALRIEVCDGRTTLRYEAHDHSRRATTTFTALAALAVADGRLDAGVVAPEAWPDPDGFLRELLTDRDIRVRHWRDAQEPRPLATGS